MNKNIIIQKNIKKYIYKIESHIRLKKIKIIYKNII